MPASPRPLPGFDTPTASFEQPFDMLEACHERVRRSLDLLRRLADYVDEKGHDASTRSAASDVLRYFDLAAPLHHEDEEKHVFPRLRVHEDASLRQAVQSLQGDHARMEAAWATLRVTLVRWTRTDASDTVDAAARLDIARFLDLYATHMETEETRVFPAARAGMNAGELATMGQEMQTRRRA